MPAKKTATKPKADAPADKRTPAKGAAALLPIVHQTLKSARAGRDEAKEKLDQAVDALKAVQAQDSRVTSAINLISEVVEDSNVSAGTEDAALRDLQDFLEGVETDPTEPVEPEKTVEPTQPEDDSDPAG